MANSISASLRQHWVKKFQSLLEENLVVMDLANMSLKSDLKDGTTINYPRPASMGIASYTKYTDVTAQDLTTSNETLVINKTPVVMFAYDEVDALEQYLDVVSEQLDRNVFTIKRYIEGQFFNQYSNAAYNNGSAVTLSITSTDAAFPAKVYGTAYATLANDGVDTSKLALVVDPFQLEIIGRATLGNTFNVADESYKRGYRGEFQGFKVYVSNNLTCTATLDLATNPTATNTVTINGVVFTFVSSIGTTAGNVLIGADADASAQNLVAAINGGAGAGTTYVDVGAAVRNSKLAGITAADGTDLITLTSLHGYRAVSSSMTAAANDWKDVIIHNLAMEKGAIHMVLQKEISMEVRQEPKQLSSNYFVWTRFGIKTFSEGAERMYDIRIKAQADEA